jgi:hypothetical protein
MTATAKEQEAKKPQATEPAKGGTEKGSEKVHESEDSPKPHGDPLNHLTKKN